MSQISLFEKEVESGNRFEFGKNWNKFLSELNESRIAEARSSILKALKLETLAGLTFIDVGCGSGLFSLAAKQLGAQVFSFDFDPNSVKCAQFLKEKFYPKDNNWTIQQGSVLDREFLGGLPKFDIVYSWGVLHHTGKMYEALENVTLLLAPKSQLFISLYNDQRILTKYWIVVKKLYNKLPKPLQAIMVFFYAQYFILVGIAADLALRVNPLTRYSGKNRRGMTIYRDAEDWVGGYPFEVSKPEEIFEFYRKKNLELSFLKTVGGKHGCNEYVFHKKAE